MSIRRISYIAGIAACLGLSAGTNLLATPPIGVGALTARQNIKDKVITALSDGSISPRERADILMKAETILQPQEMEGLQRTLDRLQRQTQPDWTEEAPMLPQSSRRSMEPYAWQEPRTSRLLQPTPYLRSPSGQRPLLRGGGLAGLGQRLPYIDQPTWHGNRIRQLAAELPRLNELSPGRPTLFASRNPREFRGQGNWSTSTLMTSQVRQAERPPKRYSQYGASPSSPKARNTYSADELPAVETPVAMAPLPEEDSLPTRPTAEQASYRSKTDYRTSRTAYLESLRDR
ncbi:MAG: hypothetical protein JXB10_17055 [Pirellulales bacterium]|nr:hypothetical protein [Pirellulales bacterium]